MASSYTVSWQAYWSGPDKGEVLEVTYVITAHTDGTVTDISTNTDTIHDGISTYTDLIKGRELTKVEAFPTSGGTAPDAADVTVSDSDGLDLLNGNGTGLIHATDKKSTYPLNDVLPSTITVRGALTIAIANQGTNGADFTIRLCFK